MNDDIINFVRSALDVDPANREREPLVAEAFLFVFVYPNGAEGPVGVFSPEFGVSTPAMTTDAARAERMKPLMRRMARDQKCKIRLIRLSVRQDIEEYGP